MLVDLQSTVNREERVNRLSPSSTAIFKVKVTLPRLRWTLRNILSDPARRYPISNQIIDKPIVGRSVTALWTQRSHSERTLVAGKIHNLRIAIKALNGVEVPAGSVFSFWKQLGRPSRWKGYVRGRELRQGCLIPSIGGGLCQLSNALYDAALNAGLEILERHAHTQVVAGSLAEVGRDATVLWNYVDLRFKSKHAFRIEARLTSDALVVVFRSDSFQPALAGISGRRTPAFSLPGGCDSCGEISCARYIKKDSTNHSSDRTAYLLDEYWPEFDDYIRVQKRCDDVLGIPISGRRIGRPNYAWDTEGFRRVTQAPLITLRRSRQLRRLNPQGAAIQECLLKFDQRLAISLASLLMSFDVTHVVVTQTLLPFLWQDGYLGGPTFDVLMTRLPFGFLQARLDLAAQQHPESKTLTDFRVNQQLVEAEAEALAHARRVITPHQEIAELLRDRVLLLDWHLPRIIRQPVRGNRIVFAASTLARKGAYEMRDAALELGLELTVMGRSLEGEGFWDGIITRRADTDWLDGASFVVLPVYVEHRPRRLLEAIACGIPVIASPSCGLGNRKGVITVPAGDGVEFC